MPHDHLQNEERMVSSWNTHGHDSKNWSLPFLQRGKKIWSASCVDLRLMCFIGREAIHAKDGKMQDGKGKDGNKSGKRRSRTTCICVSSTSRNA